MNGFYVVEIICDYATQLVAFKTKKECYEWINKKKKTNKYFSTKNLWVTYYKFGEQFSSD